MAKHQYRVLRWHVSPLTYWRRGANSRHVAKTDVIKDLVITEESSIAKGIRRIVAVTGHEANDVSRKAVDFERRLDRIEGLEGKDKEAALKPYLAVSTRNGTMNMANDTGTWAKQNIAHQATPLAEAVRQDL